MPKLNKSFNVFLVKGKHRCLLLFISFCFSSVTFIHVALHLFCPNFYCYFRAFLTSLNSLHVINTCSVLFFMDAGNNALNGVNLYITFLCFFKHVNNSIIFYFYLKMVKSTSNSRILLGAYDDCFNRVLHW